MKIKYQLFRFLVAVFLLTSVFETFAASELPVLTEDTNDPVLYRIKNTRRTAKGTANYWTTTGLSTLQDEATQVYFTGKKEGIVMCVKIHLKDSENTLTADYQWGNGVDWYIKQYSSAQGGVDATTGYVYKGVLISNSSSFPNVNDDKPADDGLGCWYVGSSNTAAWLYGGQWDGSIFTLEVVDPTRIPQSEPSTSLIVNPSFEEGDLTGWVYGALGGDHFVKPNTDEIFTTSGTDGYYLFNTWYSNDNYAAETQNQTVYQTIRNLPVGEYRLSAKVSSNAKNDVTLFANDFTTSFVPPHKSSFTDYELDGIFVTSDVRSLTVGLRSVSWFRADDFKLESLGETEAYKAYVAKQYSDASLGRPVLFDAFDGQTTEEFTYTEIGGHTHGGYPISTGGIMNDRTMVDRSLMQIWTGVEYSLGSSTTSVTYDNLPNGYYRISSTVRVYDQNGSYSGKASGLSIYANEKSTAITTGTSITHGDLSGKGFCDDYSVIAEVKDGKLEAGLKIGSSSFNWLGWQNFRVEYIGTKNPADGLLDYAFTEGTYVPLCMPFEMKPAYYGQTYTVACIKDGQAVLLPVQTVASGVPCVIKASGDKPTVSLDKLKLNFDALPSSLSLWDNVLMKGNHETHCWTGTYPDGTEVDAKALTYVEADLSNLTFSASIENRAAAAFWAQNPNYSTSTTSVIEKYLHQPTYARSDQPNPVLIPVNKKSVSQRVSYSLSPDFTNMKNVTVAAGNTLAEVYNLIPGLTYYYKSNDGKCTGQFTVDGTLRMIYVGDNVYNVRDLGGKRTSDGRYVQYGRLFRSGELNGGYKATTAELKIMRDMGVGAEVDLRNEEDGTGTSPFKFTEAAGTYYAVRGTNYIADTPDCIDKEDAKMHWKNEFEMIVSNLREGRGVDFHCRIGADRTGMLAILLEGVLGVNEADMLRDYETTSFSTAAGTRVKDATGFNNLIKNTFKKNIPTGGTLRDAFNAYFINKLGVSQALIDEFRELMLSDDPTSFVTPVEVPQLDAQSVSASRSEAVYDLSGRKMSVPSHGIYIKGNKKIVVR